MKKVCSLILIIMLLFAATVPAAAAQSEPVSPQYINTSQAGVSITINTSGKVSITVMCIGGSTATKIHTVTYLERQVGSSWVRVDIDEVNDEWVDTVSGSRMAINYSHDVTVRGTYKVTTVFTVYGTKEDETFTLYNTRTY